ncbi:MAG: inorganic diphosphatase [Saprospiraceae bacterium]
MKKLNYLSVLFVGLLLLGCKEEKVKYELIPALTEKGINAVIEIPAGTNHKAEYNYDSGGFDVEIRNGKKRVISFVPYVGNYGFIPSTYMDPAIGGDGDALDVLVIAESVPSGTVMEVIPIATLELIDSKEIDTKLVAVPADPALRVIDATDFMTFTLKYNAAQQIIQNWFLNYKGPGIMEMKGWKDERHAMSEVKKWLVKKPKAKK